MRRLSFIIAIVFLAVLTIMLYAQKQVQITHQDNLTNLLQNQKLLIQGKVIKQTSSAIYLSNSLILSCDNCPSYLNQNITAEAILETWTGKPIIKVLKLST